MKGSKPLPPRSSTAAFKEIQRILQMGLVVMPIGKSFGGHGAPGRLLEQLLGIVENNMDSPDLKDWEVKFHGGGTLITLFHKDPQPRGVVRLLVHEHGWNDEKNRISFRHTLGGESPRGFYVVNDSDRIIVRHRTKDTVNPYWKHNTLLNIAGAKLRRLIVVKGKLVKHPVRAVTFTEATAYWDFNVSGFFDAIVKGKILIDFDARTKEGAGSGLRNHGTKFRIHPDNLLAMFEHSKKITNGKG